MFAKIRKNKRGAFSEIIVDIFVIIIFIFIVVLFLMIFKFMHSQVQNEITFKVEANEADLNLLSFLRAPVDENQDMADYIAKTIIEDEDSRDALAFEKLPDSYNIINDEVKDVLLKFHGDICSNVIIQLISPEQKIIKTRTLGYPCGKTGSYASVTLPTKKAFTLVNISLMQGTKFYKYLLCKNSLGEYNCLPVTFWDNLFGTYDRSKCTYVEQKFDNFNECLDRAEGVI